MKNPPWLIVGVLGSALLFTGCGKKSSDTAGRESSEHAEGEEGGETGVTYKEGRGLQLVPEVIKALDLRTVEADEREVTAELEVTAQVFATKPKVLASASLPVDRAELLRDASFEGASLVRIDTSTTTATRLADAVFALESTPSRQIGDFVQIAIKGKPTKVLTVPRSAILDAAAGTFVYVVNGNAYLRTPVKVGARSGELVEITDGVYAGDVVVASPIEQLWLAELRLTKGGGHAH
jgi:multidrug efflux pump subunit AcrA (membrane-fusion protein)